MIDNPQIDIPAECRISFEERSITTECTTRLIYKNDADCTARGVCSGTGFVMILFQHGSGILAFGGDPAPTASQVRVTTFGTDSSDSFTTTGACSINAESIRISCSAKIGAEYVTVTARGWK